MGTVGSGCWMAFPFVEQLVSVANSNESLQQFLIYVSETSALYQLSRKEVGNWSQKNITSKSPNFT